MILGRKKENGTDWMKFHSWRKILCVLGIAHFGTLRVCWSKTDQQHINLKATTFLVFTLVKIQ